MQKIVVATNNAGKLKEFQHLFDPNAFELVSQQQYDVPSVAETGLTFVENALIKARHACKHTQLMSIADDSGLVVPGLQGAPGIYSSRYAGIDATDQQNIEKLLHALSGFAPEQRKAYFYCVIVLLAFEDSPTPLIAAGRWDGIIANEPSGQQGFGYDPVFFIPELNCTSAQLELSVKNVMSHRARAFGQLQELCKLENCNDRT